VQSNQPTVPTTTLFFSKKSLDNCPKSPPPTNPNFYFLKRTLVCKLGTLAWNLKFYKNNNNNNHLAYKLGEIACNLTKKTHKYTHICANHMPLLASYTKKTNTRSPFLQNFEKLLGPLTLIFVCTTGSILDGVKKKIKKNLQIGYV
jgi:hypothetical protein